MATTTEVTLSYEHAFGDLEPPIDRAVALAHAAGWVAGILADRNDSDGMHRVSTEALRTLTDLVFEAERSIKAVSDLWLAQHNTIVEEKAT